MAISKTLHLLNLSLLFACFQIAISCDPSILSDYIIPDNLKNVDGHFFTYTGLRKVLGGQTSSNVTIFRAQLKEFPALDGQSLSYSAIMYPPGGLNPPHTHPRSAELLFLISGSLEVGFVDTNKKLFAQTLHQGDVFVFPKGLIHYQLNVDSKNPARSISAFSSANAGTLPVAASMFNTGIDSSVLAKAFKTNPKTVENIKVGFNTA